MRDVVRDNAEATARGGATPRECCGRRRRERPRVGWVREGLGEPCNVGVIDGVLRRCWLREGGEVDEVASGGIINEISGRWCRWRTSWAPCLALPAERSEQSVLCSTSAAAAAGIAAQSGSRRAMAAAAAAAGGAFGVTAAVVTAVVTLFGATLFTG